MSGLGTFAGGGLGMGVAFVLHDEFSNAAQKIEASMGKLDAQTDMLASKIDRSMTKIKMGFGMVAAGAIILAPFIAGVKNASDLEENLNKSRVAFGKYSRDVEAFASKSIDTFGVDRIAALDMASLYGDMSTGMGFTQERASQLAITLTGLAGDLASFKNISHEVAQTALKGIFTGETESLKGLGIVMTEANLQTHMAVNGINKKFKDLSQTEKVLERFNYVMSVSKNSIGDFSRTSEGYANSKRTFMGALKEVSATLGNILMPMFARMFQWATRLAKKFKEFAESPMGKSILKIIAAVGALLIVGGLLLMLMGGIRFMVYKAAFAFGALTRAQILSTIASRGTVAGLRMIGAAAWTALGPFILIAAGVLLIVKVFKWLKSTIYSTNPAIMALGTAILFALGPIGWIILAINWMRRALMEFDNFANGTSKKQTGFIGFLQKLGGVLRGVQAIWKSWNDTTQTFELSKAFEAKLKDLGIYQLVINLGTWIARIKAFMKGVKEAFTEAWEWIKGIVKGIMKSMQDSMEKVTGPWDKLHAVIGKNTQSMEKWKQYGKIAGKVLLVIIGALIIAMLAMGAVALLVLFLMLAPFIAIGYAIYKIRQAWIAFTSDLKLAWSIWGVMWDNMIQYFDELPGRIYQAGADMINSIWDGMRSAWDGMVQWLTEAWNSVLGIFGGSSNPVVNAVINRVTGSTDTGTPSASMAKATERTVQRRTQLVAETKAAAMPANIWNPGAPAAKEQPAPVIHNHIMLDGNKIAEHVIDKTKYKDARRG